MIKSSCLICFRCMLRICYTPFKLLKRRDKVVLLSRQVDKPGLDFLMLSEEIKRISPDTEIVILCKRIGNGIAAKAEYFFHMLVQMYHLATSKAAVLDGYCITACILKHREGIKIYQIWHALGLLKNFAYTALGNKEGTTAATAEIMCMHRGYHRIICSSEALIGKIAACYDAPEEIMLPIGLPRIDFLTSPQLLDSTLREIFTVYPELSNGKPSILYAPTLRKGKEVSADELIRATDFKKYNLIIKKHNGDEEIITDKGHFSRADDFTGLEWLAAANYAVTDYSAIIFEAMCAGLPVFLYCFDRNNYNTVRGFATDYASIPAPHCDNAADLMREIENYTPDTASVEKFLDIHVSARKLHTTKALAYVITEEMHGKAVDRRLLLTDSSLQKHKYQLK